MVLLALGLDGYMQDHLESEHLSAMKLSIEHRHFKKSAKRLPSRAEGPGPSSCGGVAEICRVCRDTFGIFGGAEDADSGFACLFNECL